VTPLATPTFSATVTVSGPTAVVPLPTWTVDDTTSTGPIVSTLPVPNPGAVAVAVELNRPVDGLTLKIYTKSMVAIDSVSRGACAQGWVSLGLPPKFLAEATNGTYYYVVTAQKNGSEKKAPLIGKLLIFK